MVTIFQVGGITQSEFFLISPQTILSQEHTAQTKLLRNALNFGFNTKVLAFLIGFQQKIIVQYAIVVHSIRYFIPFLLLYILNNFWIKIVVYVEGLCDFFCYVYI